METFRIKILFSKPKEGVEINNQHLVNSYIHKLLGTNNPYHDTVSNYCVSWLCGGKLNPDNETLSFKTPFIVVTSIDKTFIDKIINGLSEHPEFTHGMKFKDYIYISETFYNGWNHFFALSPVYLAEQKYGEKRYFVTQRDKDYNTKLKDRTIKRLKKIDPTLDLSDFDIVTYDTNKVKFVKVNKLKFLVTSGKFSIHCNRKVAQTIYSYGLGQSTGSGFGTLYYAYNQPSYKY